MSFPPACRRNPIEIILLFFFEIGFFHHIIKDVAGAGAVAVALAAAATEAGAVEITFAVAPAVYSIAIAVAEAVLLLVSAQAAHRASPITTIPDQPRSLP